MKVIREHPVISTVAIVLLALVVVMIVNYNFVSGPFETYVKTGP